MDRQEWINRCSARLHAQWPRVPREQLAEVAEEIAGTAHQQLDDPERAAHEWLRLGIPEEAQRHAG